MGNFRAELNSDSPKLEKKMHSRSVWQKYNRYQFKAQIIEAKKK